MTSCFVLTLVLLLLLALPSRPARASITTSVKGSCTLGATLVLSNV